MTVCGWGCAETQYCSIERVTLCVRGRPLRDQVRTAAVNALRVSDVARTGGTSGLGGGGGPAFVPTAAVAKVLGENWASLGSGRPRGAVPGAAALTGLLRACGEAAEDVGGEPGYWAVSLRGRKLLE